MNALATYPKNNRSTTLTWP